MKLFKIRASACAKIMGRIGLTEAQTAELNDLQGRSIVGPKLTKNMELKLADLAFRLANPKLPETCTTFLKEWYANDYEEISSKYMEKGNYVEQDNIDFAARVLGYGMAEKNTVKFSDEWMTGEPDSILTDAILETKAPWNRKTLQEQALAPLDADYEFQVRVYMRLLDKPKSYLFYGLQNTPETDWRPEIIYDDKPENERWFASLITRDVAMELDIIKRVELCRLWLDDYDKRIKDRMGKLI